MHAQQVKKNSEERLWKQRIEGYYNNWDNDAISIKHDKKSKHESSSESDTESDNNSGDEEEDIPNKKKKKKKNNSKKKKDNNDISYSIPDDISLQDLLEILQGPVPVEQRIVIATTNDYEGIKNLCPALFRPGRLTPVLFDNPSKEILNEISMYYFKKKLDIYLPDKLERPTSEIIDLCLKAHTFEDPYEYFKGEVDRLIKLS